MQNDSNQDSHKECMMMDKRLLKIYFPNGSFHSLRYTDNTTIQDVISIVLKGRVSAQELPSRNAFWIRARCEYSEDALWLLPDYHMQAVSELLNPMDSRRFELRIRQFPLNLSDLCSSDKLTFSYLHEQLKQDYCQHFAGTVEDIDTSIQLGCLNIRKLLCDLHPSSMQQKINMDYLEKEVGMKHFFHENLLSSTKPRQLRRSVKAYLREFTDFNEYECMLNYAEILKKVWLYDQEYFNCKLGDTWNTPIKLIVSPNGISYKIRDNSVSIFELADFVSIKQVCRGPEHCSIVLITSSVEKSPSIRFSNADVISDLCSLINGYCTLRKGHVNSLIIDPALSSSYPGIGSVLSNRGDSNPDILTDWSDQMEDDLPDLVGQHLISKDQVQLIEVLGQGNFGHVYRGKYTDGNSKTHIVAVKAAREDDCTTSDRCLLEASVLLKFQHHHITRVYGVCLSNPVLIIMELARYGELRKFLRNNRDLIDLVTLLLYCFQLATALEFLEIGQFVHRDIATRNVLVMEWQCVKLGDFGMSRQLNNNCYTASHGRLPVRWMAPESINFRRFTHASDVWMFGVCIWEILSFGEKPYCNLTNNMVLDMVESGDHLNQPYGCPDEVFQLMETCWNYEPSNRPNFTSIRQTLGHILDIVESSRNTRSIKSANQIKVPLNMQKPRSPRDDDIGNCNFRSGVQCSIDTDTDSKVHQDKGRCGKEHEAACSLSCQNGYPNDQNSHTVKSLGSQPANDHRFMIDLHTEIKQVVGAVLALNVLLNNGNPGTTYKQVVGHVREIVLCVKDYLHQVDSYTSFSIASNAASKFQVLENHRCLVEEMTILINELQHFERLDEVIKSGIRIATISKNIFDLIQDNFYQSTSV